jgi:hypothetical protein
MAILELDIQTSTTVDNELSIIDSEATFSKRSELDILYGTALQRPIADSVVLNNLNVLVSSNSVIANTLTSNISFKTNNYYDISFTPRNVNAVITNESLNNTVYEVLNNFETKRTELLGDIESLIDTKLIYAFNKSLSKTFSNESIPIDGTVDKLNTRTDLFTADIKAQIDHFIDKLNGSNGDVDCLLNQYNSIITEVDDSNTNQNQSLPDGDGVMGASTVLNQFGGYYMKLIKAIEASINRTNRELKALNDLYITKNETDPSSDVSIIGKLRELIEQLKTTNRDIIGALNFLFAEAKRIKGVKTANRVISSSTGFVEYTFSELGFPIPETLNDISLVIDIIDRPANKDYRFKTEIYDLSSIDDGNDVLFKVQVLKEMATVVPQPYNCSSDPIKIQLMVSFKNSAPALYISKIPTLKKFGIDNTFTAEQIQLNVFTVNQTKVALGANMTRYVYAAYFGNGLNAVSTNTSLVEVTTEINGRIVLKAIGTVVVDTEVTVNVTDSSGKVIPIIVTLLA